MFNGLWYDDTIQQVHWSREVQNPAGDSLKSRHSIFLTRCLCPSNLTIPYFWPFFPSHATQLKKATYFDSLQFIGEVKQKVNKLHMLAKKVLPRFPCILWRKIFLQIWSRCRATIWISCKFHTTQYFQVGWGVQPVWKETTCIARQSEEDDTLKLEAKRNTYKKRQTKRKVDKEKGRQIQRQTMTRWGQPVHIYNQIWLIKNQALTGRKIHKNL